jgi:alpha-N-arabinofuranosidase
MEKGGQLMEGVSLHYYTVPGEWKHKGSATEFNGAEWYLTMRKAGRMEELVAKHSAIMDEFDPKRRIGLVVDEWGTWFDSEPGTVPGFLYQQNTLRDALVAGIHLNIFNNSAERVFMANIAQTVNVLQAVILTEGPAMILTPTYHVFDLYKAHQDALKLPVYVESDSVQGFPAITASASEGADRKIRISLTNIDLEKEQTVQIDLRGYAAGSSTKLSGQIVTGENMADHNTAENPHAVTLRPFGGAVLSPGGLTARLPPKSVVNLELA